MSQNATDALEALSSDRNVSSRLVMEELMAAFDGPQGLAREIRLQYNDMQDPRDKYRVLKGVVDSTLKLGEIQHDAGQNLDDQTEAMMEKVQQALLGELPPDQRRMLSSALGFASVQDIDPSLEDAGRG